MNPTVAAARRPRVMANVMSAGAFLIGAALFCAGNGCSTVCHPVPLSGPGLAALSSPERRALEKLVQKAYPDTPVDSVVVRDVGLGRTGADVYFGRTQLDANTYYARTPGFAMRSASDGPPLWDSLHRGGWYLNPRCGGQYTVRCFLLDGGPVFASIGPMEYEAALALLRAIDRREFITSDESWLPKGCVFPIRYVRQISPWPGGYLVAFNPPGSNGGNPARAFVREGGQWYLRARAMVTE